MASRTQKQPWRKPTGLYVGTGSFSRFVGVLDEYRRVYRKHLRESRHLFQKLDAWAIDAQLFNDTILPGSFSVVINDDETGRVYQASAKTIAQHGRYFHFKEGNTNHKAQIFLPRAYWLRTVDRSGKSAPVVDPRTLDAGTPFCADAPAAVQTAEERAAVDVLFESL